MVFSTILWSAVGGNEQNRGLEFEVGIEMDVVQALQDFYHCTMNSDEKLDLG